MRVDRAVVVAKAAVGDIGKVPRRNDAAQPPGVAIYNTARVMGEEW